jgi:DNA polymerase III delta prime subunit
VNSIVNSIWSEKYRPQTVSDCILPTHLKEAFSKFLKDGDIPNMIFSGPPGIGKTTVAKALCHDLGADWMIINGSDETGIDTFRNKIKTFASTVSLSERGKKVVILDEGENLNPNSTQPALRNFTEEYSASCRFIFTANYKHKIIPALHSRFTEFEFSIPEEEKLDVLKQLVKRTIFILNNEGIEYNKTVLYKLVVKHFPDFRKIICELQKYANIYGSIDVGILPELEQNELTPLVKAMKEKKFFEVRKWIVENMNGNPDWIFRALYDNLEDIFATNSIPQAIIYISEYAYRAAFVADHEINLIALMVNLMADCEFK